MNDCMLKEAIELLVKIEINLRIISCGICVLIVLKGCDLLHFLI